MTGEESVSFCSVVVNFLLFAGCSGPTYTLACSDAEDASRPGDVLSI